MSDAERLAKLHAARATVKEQIAEAFRGRDAKTCYMLQQRSLELSHEIWDIEHPDLVPAHRRPENVRKAPANWVDMVLPPVVFRMKR